VLVRINFRPPLSLALSIVRTKGPEVYFHSNLSLACVLGRVWQNEYFSVVKIPPEGVSTSNLNLGRLCSFSSPPRLPIGREKSVLEKFADMDFGAGGQRVISVA
jgi:hypothetical protein